MKRLMTKNQRTGLDFGDALRALKAGECISRPDWKGVYLELVGPESGEIVMTGSGRRRPLGVFIAERSPGGLSGWNPKDADLLATDWRVLRSQ